MLVFYQAPQAAGRWRSAALSVERIFFEADGWVADANVQPRQPADAAAWVWHPACSFGETTFLRFSLDFELEVEIKCRIHVTADQRFQLRIDGREVGFGPDRGEVEAWPVASYALALAAGTHRIEALVWWLKDESLGGLRVVPSLSPTVAALRPAVAQASWRGGFLLAGEGSFTTRIDTGSAPWRVVDLTPAVRAMPRVFPVYHDIGPEFLVDGFKWLAAGATAPVAVVAGAVTGNLHGVQRPGWRLQPTSLPEQQRVTVRGGRLRVLNQRWSDGPFEEIIVSGSEGVAWSAWLRGDGEVAVSPHEERVILWDFEDYVCGYARLTTCGGSGATVRIDWAESLYEAAAPAAVNERTHKGRRGEIAGKIFLGFGDEYFPNGDAVEFPALWWRSGRYLRVQVRAGNERLVLKKLTVVSTGYPLGPAASFTTDDAVFDALLAASERTIRACAHEVWADCPYYEQMAYVGDCRLAALNNYALFADDRLSRRMLELFDGSRRNNGLVAERTPGTWQQVSVTYSLLWVLMIRDFAWWRDDPAFVRERLRGVRAMLDEVLALTSPDGLLRDVPGWPFVDWVPSWHEGCGPGVRNGDSSIVNLHLLLALRAQADLETSFGEAELAALAVRRAARLEAAIRNRYWCSERGLLADTSDRADFSEHAQALGLLAGLIPPGGIDQWVDTWLASRDLARATLYFSFYVLDALRLAGRETELTQRIQAWDDLLPMGLLTLPEAPEPTRSDCHGWSAHVRWHLVASLAGVRPAAPGFARVEVAPLFGPLRKIETEVPHPRGLLRIALAREHGRLHGTITLPADTTGELRWQNVSRPLHTGENTVEIAVVMNTL